MAVDLSTERTIYPCLLIGGSAHGTTYLMTDRPRLICAPVCNKVTLEFRVNDYCEPQRVETYVMSEARVHGFDTPWIYYRHERLDDKEGMFELWNFMWCAAERLSRAGGWDPERTCRRCSGTGRER